MDDLLRVLILEDEQSISMILEGIVEDTVPSVVVARASLAAAEQVIDQPFDLAFLDIDLLNGKSFEVAKYLQKKDVPFTFVSGASREELPDELRNTAFIPKPFRREQIRAAVLSAQSRKGGSSQTE
jgi:DNA-binding response OmpR family regulator